MVREGYLVAIALWWKIKSNKNLISFKELRKYGQKLQNLCNKQHIDVIIQRCSFKEAIDEFSDYFVNIEINFHNYIKLRRGITKEKLERLFIFPNDLLELMVNTPLEQK